jgi:hypothetical protein
VPLFILQQHYFLIRTERSSVASGAFLDIFSIFLHLLSGTVNSHFILQYPNSLGFDANNEDSGPCGGFSVTFSNASDYHMGGESIALTTLHPQSNFLFRGTLGKIASGNWMNFLPVMGEYGLGSFCVASVAAPDAWAGSQGVIQVIQDAKDGIHYQVRNIFRSYLIIEVNLDSVRP